MLSLASCYGLFIGIRFVSFRLCHIFIRYFYSEASSRRRFKFGCTKFLLIIISAAPAILCGMACKKSFVSSIQSETLAVLKYQNQFVLEHSQWR